MKLFLKYAWPLLASMAFQTFLLESMDVKPGWADARIALFLLADGFLSFLQWSRFKRDQHQRLVRRQIGLHLGLKLEP